MDRFSKRHPIVFSVLLFFAAILAAAPFAALSAGEEGGAVGRLVVAAVLLLVFRRCFRRGRPFSGLVWILPALLFPLWNIVYHLAAGMGALRPAGELPAALLLGLAPAVFEEVLFRGILIDRLRENGKSPMAALWISALLFGAEDHLLYRLLLRQRSPGRCQPSGPGDHPPVHGADLTGGCFRPARPTRKGPGPVAAKARVPGPSVPLPGGRAAVRRPSGGHPLVNRRYPSGHPVVSRWSPGGQPVVTRRYPGG